MRTPLPLITPFPFAFLHVSIFSFASNLSETSLGGVGTLSLYSTNTLTSFLHFSHLPLLVMTISHAFCEENLKEENVIHHVKYIIIVCVWKRIRKKSISSLYLERHVSLFSFQFDNHFYMSLEHVWPWVFLFAQLNSDTYFQTPPPISCIDIWAHHNCRLLEKENGQDRAELVDWGQDHGGLLWFDTFHHGPVRQGSGDLSPLLSP